MYLCHYTCVPEALKPGLPWKRILVLVFWLYAFTPVGLWKVWRDATLSASAKWRIVIYTFLLPVVAYLALSLSMMNKVLVQLVP